MLEFLLGRGTPVHLFSVLHHSYAMCFTSFGVSYAYMEEDESNVFSTVLVRLRQFGMTVTNEHVSLSLENNQDVLLENVRVGHDTGLKSALLVFSNFVTLAFILVAIQKAKNSRTRERKSCLYFVSTLMFFGMIISILYHTCQSTGICIGSAFEQWQINDHFTANLSVVSAILLVITIDDVLFYSSAGVAYIIISVLLVSSDPLSVLPTIQIVGLGCILGLVKHVLIDQGQITGTQARFSVKWIILGVLTAMAGSAFYIFDSGASYFWAHSVWHLVSSISAMFILLGCTADTPVYVIPHIHSQ